MTDTALTDEAMLTVKDITAWLKLSDRWLRQAVMLGKFPKADIRIGKVLRWTESTVAKWRDGK